eukprot:2803-Heterococcus_DN1.PRE.2
MSQQYAESEFNKANKESDEVKTDLQERLARERARSNFSIAKQLLKNDHEALIDRIAVQDAGMSSCSAQQWCVGSSHTLQLYTQVGRVKSAHCVPCLCSNTASTAAAAAAAMHTHTTTELRRPPWTATECPQFDALERPDPTNASSTVAIAVTVVLQRLPAIASRANKLHASTDFMEHWSEAKIAQHFQDLKNKTLLSAAARKDIQDYIEALCRRHRARVNGEPHDEDSDSDDDNNDDNIKDNDDKGGGSS